MTTTPTITSARYVSTEHHDVSRCENGLSPILGAVCRCGGTLFGARRGNGPAFFESLPEADPHSFKTLTSHVARLVKVRR